MAWSSFEEPSGSGQHSLYIRFKGGNALQGPVEVASSENPTDAQYQAVIDALLANSLVEAATFTETIPVARTMTVTPPEG
jgi:hypothetical protein